ncbi:3-deoxy-D-manno-octulosonic acid transferase [Commensalibacter papalotli (ex Servin-Garciduenas et al. 2014)]|uniref:3-deoxy-D-manno-octulosonic acid transferase n=1 Tax=Commensalibacter papalotli (ex Servin-Garciduenas et al. 2014) TaxID=1208583 RepID=UPI0004B5537C|nr:glycosyltransferase N-terminal domain-containing protein [Commensalibacter papalotli (ex Servin-Garciduenas et al. 2014)]
MSLYFKKRSLLLFFWKITTTLLSPLLPLYLRHRCKKGKEIKERLSERMGIASLPRKPENIIHFHAASVGEIISLFPIITAIYHIDHHQNFLITTGTLTSYRIVQKYCEEHPELGAYIQHQFVPLDVPYWTERFVIYWRPSLSVIVESELWPNFIDALYKHHIPVVLLNARLSDRSFKLWYRFGKTAYALLSKFKWIAARSRQDQLNFEKLGVEADFLGDIKQIAPELAFDRTELEQLKVHFHNKSFWLAASTHQNEEVLIVKAHHQLQKKYPNLITIIVPRHPERAKEIIEQIGPMPRRSLNQFPDAQGLWLCDTLGELGLFYRLCDIVFIGNSFDVTPKGGGHNPYEPAKLNCVIASGNKIHNFVQAYQFLDQAVTIISDLNSLVAWVDDMLCNSDKRNAYAVKSLSLMGQQNEQAQQIALRLYNLKKDAS